MMIDLTELVAESRRKRSIIRGETITLKGNKLSFVINYMNHLLNPFDSYYDAEKGEFHIIVKRDAFPYSSITMQKEFDIPQGCKKVRVNYQRRNIEGLSAGQSIEHFFPRMKSDEENQA